jgi:hypothetical protein
VQGWSRLPPDNSLTAEELTTTSRTRGRVDLVARPGTFGLRALLGSPMTAATAASTL